MIFLPESYQARIQAVEGVAEVTNSTWFGAYYQEPPPVFANMAVEPEAWLRMYPEYRLPEDQQQAWFEDQTGAIVGRATADRHGWKIGDRVPLIGTIFRRSRFRQTRGKNFMPRPRRRECLSRDAACGWPARPRAGRASP